MLRSFQFPSQQRANAIDGNAIAAHPWSDGNGISLSRSIGANDPSEDSTANGETHAQAQDGMKLSGLSNHELDLVIANLEARALERRNKIRKIEALSEELGLNIHQQDWAAFLSRPASRSSPSIAGGQRPSDQDEVQDQADAPENLEPMPIPETRTVHELTVADDASANSSSDVQAEPEAPRRSLRILRGLKRAHYQLEQQRAGSADSQEGGEVEDVVTGPRSSVRIQSLPPKGSENGGGGQSDSSRVSVDGVARRLAWSVVLETYPQEIAKKFRPGERPINNRVRSMVSLFTSRQSHKLNC